MKFLKSHRFPMVLLTLALATGALRSAPYGPDGLPIEWTQPDGSKLSLRVFGDEFYGRTETLDGYTVVFNPALKSYEYAKVSADGQDLVATGVAPGKGNPRALGLTQRLDFPPETRKAKAMARYQEWDKATENSKRWAELKARQAALQAAAEAGTATAPDGPAPSPPSSTTLGTKVGLTLLVDFSDAPATIPQATLDSFCNGDSFTSYGNVSSVKKYYQDVSSGLLTYTNVVTAYIRMAQPKSYYNNTSVDCGIQGRLLVSDAIDIMKALPNYSTAILPLFSPLTVDGSKRVVATNVLFAGSDSGAWDFGLWPHSYSLASAKELSSGGMKVYKYQITNIGTSPVIGTFCHENGHMLCGYPDLYDYGKDSVGGAGAFSLMCYSPSKTNPCLIDAYLRRASGWTTTTELTSTSSLTASLTATVGSANFNKIYRYAKPGTSTEYFLFENRQKTGRDANIPASGIAIWHVDELGNRDNQSLVPNTTHANYELTLVQADNLWHFETTTTNQGDPKDLYYLGNAAAAYTNSFKDSSTPNANWWSGAASGAAAFNFSSSAATMTFRFGALAAIAVEQPAGTNLVNGSATINCGAVNVSYSSLPITFIIRNLGASDLTGLALSKDGAHSADYMLGGLGATTLTSGASTSFTVTFSPGMVGTRTAAIHIASNDAVNNPFDISLTGTGIGPGTLAVTPAGGLISSGTYGGSFAPASLQYTLSNPGITPLNWAAAQTSSWVDLSATNGTLAAGANTTVTVSINSNASTLAANSYGDTVTFTNTTNGNGNTTRDVALTVTAASGYAGWAATNAPTGAANDDYDGDGVSNGVEYVLGGARTTNDSGKLPKVSTGSGYVVFSFKRDQASIDGSTAVTIEVGSTLGSWPDSYTVGADSAGSSPEVNIVKGVPTGFDTVTLTVTQAPDVKKFARLKVVMAAP